MPFAEGIFYKEAVEACFERGGALALPGESIFCTTGFSFRRLICVSAVAMREGFP